MRPIKIQISCTSMNRGHQFNNLLIWYKNKKGNKFCAFLEITVIAKIILTCL